MPRVAKLRLASRMRLFELSENLYLFFFISIAKCRNVIKWNCGS